jgi:hypothetical protein
MKKFIKAVKKTDEENVYNILNSQTFNDDLSYEFIKQSNKLEDLFDMFIVQFLDGHLDFCETLKEAKKKEIEYLENLADIFGAIETDIGYKVVAKYDKNKKEFNLFYTKENNLSAQRSLDTLYDILNRVILRQSYTFNFNDLEKNSKYVNNLKEIIEKELKGHSKVYCVLSYSLESHQNKIASLSSEGYKTFEEARDFILSRSDKPEPLLKNCKCWSFRSEDNIYEIREIKVK